MLINKFWSQVANVEDIQSWVTAVTVKAAGMGYCKPWLPAS